MAGSSEQFEPDQEPRYDDLEGEGEFTDILENLIIKKVPTEMLKPGQKQEQNLKSPMPPTLDYNSRIFKSESSAVNVNKNDKPPPAAPPPPPPEYTRVPEKNEDVPVPVPVVVKEPVVNHAIVERPLPPPPVPINYEHNYCICGTSLFPINPAEDNKRLHMQDLPECHCYTEPLSNTMKTVMFADQITSARGETPMGSIDLDKMATKNMMGYSPIYLMKTSPTRCSRSSSPCYNVNTSYQHEEDYSSSSPSKVSSPPPDIQQTIDILKMAQPRKKTPGFPARNQRSIHHKRHGNTPTTLVGKKVQDVSSIDDTAPIVHYEDRMMRHQDIRMISSSTDINRTSTCCSKPDCRCGDTNTSEASKSATQAESDLTVESKSSGPVAEISQVKGQNLKWKIIIKHHKGKKDQSSILDN